MVLLIISGNPDILLHDYCLKAQLSMVRLLGRVGPRSPCPLPNKTRIIAYFPLANGK